MFQSWVTISKPVDELNEKYNNSMNDAPSYFTPKMTFTNGTNGHSFIIENFIM